MEQKKTCYYELLNVERDCNSTEIKKVNFINFF
jgi:curved DNA-binding protein CbpA